MSFEISQIKAVFLGESFEQPLDRLHDDSPLGSEEASTLFLCPGGCQAPGVCHDHGLLIFMVTEELQSPMGLGQIKVPQHLLLARVSCFSWRNDSQSAASL